MAELSSYIASHRIFQFHNILTKPFLILYRPVNIPDEWFCPIGTFTVYRKKLPQVIFYIQSF